QVVSVYLGIVRNQITKAENQFSRRWKVWTGSETKQEGANPEDRASWVQVWTGSETKQEGANPEDRASWVQVVPLARLFLVFRHDPTLLILFITFTLLLPLFIAFILLLASWKHVMAMVKADRPDDDPSPNEEEIIIFSDPSDKGKMEESSIGEETVEKEEEEERDEESEKQDESDKEREKKGESDKEDEKGRVVSKDEEELGVD
ncbi:hypothetical protein BJ684DRAFT_16748, partial [Piptocephalis cylindrospora]